MKRQVLAVAVASLFALPALANYELYGNGIAPEAPVSTKSRADVRAELVAAQASGEWIVNAELGTTEAAPMQLAGKSRAEVLAELTDAQRSGDFVVNAELGLKANQLFPHEYGHPVVASK